MAHNNVLRWLDGRGWLVFSSGHDYTSAIRARVLGQMAADGSLAYICLGAVDLCEGVMTDFEDLGAPAGYLVDILSEDDDTIRQKLADASVIVLSDIAAPSELRSALMGAGVGGMQTAFQNGAVILAEGGAAAVFGEWIAGSENELLDGLGWLQDGLIIPGISSLVDSQTARQALLAHPSAIAVTIGAESALALGPDGEVEPWGNRNIAVALGSDYKP